MKRQIFRPRQGEIRIPDERLNALGDRFTKRQIGKILKISFDRYIGDPVHYDRIIRHLELRGGRIAPDGTLILTRAA